jgi:hypothetical protein
MQSEKWEERRARRSGRRRGEGLGVVVEAREKSVEEQEGRCFLCCSMRLHTTWVVVELGSLGSVCE